MKLKITSPRKRTQSPPDCLSDPEEKEISEDDDDDRNHKHRRRDARSQSLERDNPDQVYSRPYRKRNNHVDNGHLFRGNDTQTSRNYNLSPLDRDLASKFERRHPGFASTSRGPLDLNHRIGGNQTFSGEMGLGRGRGRDLGSWNQHVSRFSPLDLASQMVQSGAMSHNRFGGRGLSNVPNAQNPSWSAFGMLPGVPNGGLDTLHPLSLQGPLRAPVNPSMTKGISRQRCRDFEERGFCLRGDMCPMEHGVNRIVIEDVQSLSQFNLPVSLPSAQLLAAPTIAGPLPSVGASSTLINGNGGYSKNSKPGGMYDDGLEFNDAYIGTGGADLYDPDQPLWNNNAPETSTPGTALHSPRVDETEPLLGGDRQQIADNESTIVSTQNQTPPVWGNVGRSKSVTNAKDKHDATLSSSNYLEIKAKETKEGLLSSQRIFRHGKWNNADDPGLNSVNTSSRTDNDASRNVRKLSQKAQRTLFVNGVPHKSNKTEALLAHFQKFGEVIDVYIPLNSERAFVQFSRREEAEAALKAPDAVMGNRFIKLWWANRDSIPDEGMSGGSSVLATHSLTAAPVQRQFHVANKTKDNFQSTACRANDNSTTASIATVISATAPKASAGNAAEVFQTSVDYRKSAGTNGPRFPPSQKKLETLEQLKEEVRKKQESLDQKRNEFRRQLEKLAKQKMGLKGDVAIEPAAKQLKVLAADTAKVVTPKPSDPGAVTVSLPSKVESTSMANALSNHPKTNTGMTLQESSSLEECRHATTFIVTPPLPTDFVDVAVMKEHFSIYGDLLSVVLEDVEAQDSSNISGTSKDVAARITFTIPESAEAAFANAKCWKGQNLRFVWVTSSSSSDFNSGKEILMPSVKDNVNTVVEAAPSIDSNEVAAVRNKEESETYSGAESSDLVKVAESSGTPVSGEQE